MQTGKQFEIPPGTRSDWRVGIVYAPYYKEETDALVKGAKDMLLQAGLSEANIILSVAPGSFEVPLLGRALADSGKVDAMIGFGIIVQGDTHHARLLAEEVTRAMMEIQMDYVMPFAYEVLYVNDLEQARARSTGESNKGREAAFAVLQSLVELEKIRNA
jgi:6,7-dimethyl-8-ribityllumazine synthase